MCLKGMYMEVDLVHGVLVVPLYCQILVHGLGGALRDLCTLAEASPSLGTARSE